MTEPQASAPEDEINRARRVLGQRNLVFVGLMGAGKSVIGRLVAQMLGIPFVDSDHEIERVSRMTIPELFAAYGEPEFRALETRVIRRLLRTGPRVLSTGGGAFVNDAIRKMVLANGLSVWLEADLEVLWSRVSKRDTRPLLRTADPKRTLSDLLDQRYPIYQMADVTVQSRDEAKEIIALETVAALAQLDQGQETVPTS
ncbi:shikimate kinase [Hoeflea sp. YIM 152468]|uniref:shikimate kinase n=1 Tax=Hoeflea sp. YIM 152468 TaxID=3031759 RepID=UPI0023DA41AD|nr:shikimate kinase [Hoeflea sp. YIM 152468]MDF1608075.1 shikimate kinase [Hoeflea sp. YIM 152468]